MPSPLRRRKRARAGIRQDGPLRDPGYIEWIKSQPCILTGFYATQYEGVDPMHIGTLGKGIKSPDNEVLPVRHSYHAQAHSEGEISFLRKTIPTWLFREMLRVYARSFYHRYKAEMIDD